MAGFCFALTFDTGGLFMTLKIRAVFVFMMMVMSLHAKGAEIVEGSITGESFAATKPLSPRVNASQPLSLGKQLGDLGRDLKFGGPIVIDSCGYEEAEGMVPGTITVGMVAKDSKSKRILRPSVLLKKSELPLKTGFVNEFDSANGNISLRTSYDGSTLRNLYETKDGHKYVLEISADPMFTTILGVRYRTFVQNADGTNEELSSVSCSAAMF